jgi:hypothetical protein
LGNGNYIKNQLFLIGTEARGGRFLRIKGLISPVQIAPKDMAMGYLVYRFSFDEGTYNVKRERIFI